MQIAELKEKLAYLIQKYVLTDELQKRELLELLAMDPVPVKGLLADLTPYLKGCSESDGRLIKDIVFNYV